MRVYQKADNQPFTTAPAIATIGPDQTCVAGVPRRGFLQRCLLEEGMSNGEYPRIGYVTDAGPNQEVNYDAHAVVNLPYAKLLVLAEGMEGKRGGNTTTEIAIYAIRRHLESARPDTEQPELVQKMLCEAVAGARTRLEGDNAGKGETPDPPPGVVAALVVGIRVYICHYGDARLYLVREGQPLRVTKELSAGPGACADAPDPKASPLKTGGELLGPTLVRGSRLELEDGDAVALLSRGVYSSLSGKDTGEIVVSFPAEVAAIKLVEAAAERNTAYNTTAMVYQPGPPKLPPTPVEPEIPHPVVQRITGDDRRRAKSRRALLIGVFLGFVAAVAVVATRPWEYLQQTVRQEAVVTNHKAPIADEARDAGLSTPATTPDITAPALDILLAKASPPPSDEGTDPDVVAQPPDKGTDPDVVAQPPDKGTDPDIVAQPPDKGTDPDVVAQPPDKGTDLPANPQEACTADGLGGKDPKWIGQMRTMADKCASLLKKREGRDAASEFGKVKWRFKRLTPEGKKRCRPLVDQLASGLSTEYLRLSSFFAGRGQCRAAKARAGDAREFGANDAQVHKALGKCAPAPE